MFGRCMSGLRSGLLVMTGLFALSPIPGLAADLTVGGTGADPTTMRVLGDAFEKAHPGTTVNVLPSLGSGGGVKVVLAGRMNFNDFGAVRLVVPLGAARNRERADE